MEKYYDRFNSIGRNFCCVLYFIFFLSSHANAQSSGWRVAGISTIYPTAEAACMFNASQNPSFTFHEVKKANAPNTMNCMYTHKTTGIDQVVGTVSWWGSPCMPEYLPPHGKDDSGKDFFTYSGNNIGDSVCVGGCVQTGQKYGGWGDGQGYWESYYRNMKQTGKTCNADPDLNTEGGSCGPDSGSVTINGQKRCVPNDQNGKPKPPDPPKPKTETKTETKNSPDGSKTETTSTTTTTSNGNGKSETTTTTTTTTTAPDGTKSTSTSQTKTTKDDANFNDGSEQDKKESDLCKNNPTLNICKNSSVTGDCENTTCIGDAITCAIIQLQRKNDCELKKDTPEKILGRQISSNNDPEKSTLPTIENAQNVDLSGQNLNADGWGVGGSCVADKQISVMGQSINIPFSKLCDYLLALRSIIMLLAGIYSYKILSGAVFTV